MSDFPSWLTDVYTPEPMTEQDWQNFFNSRYCDPVAESVACCYDHDKQAWFVEFTDGSRAPIVGVPESVTRIALAIVREYFDRPKIVLNALSCPDLPQRLARIYSMFLKGGNHENVN